MTVSLLRAVEPDRVDPRRGALAAAIAASRRADDAVAARRAAIARASDQVAKADLALARATAVVAESREQHAQRLAAAAANGATVSPSSTMRAARAAEVDASDEIDAARAALSKVEAGLPDIEEAAYRARSAVVAAVARVMAPAAAVFLEETRKLQAQLAARRAILWFLWRSDDDDETWKWPDKTLELTAKDERDAPLAEIRDQIEKFFSDNSLLINAEDDAVNPWRAAHEALMLDADTPLPV